MLPPFYSIGVLITMRCNAHCKNCEKLCNLDALTGCASDDGDMTLADVERVCTDIERVALQTRTRPIATSVVFSGGEATLHPQLEAFVELAERKLLSKSLVGGVLINTNGSHPQHPCAKRFVTWTALQDKPAHHVAIFSDPAAERALVTYASCQDCTRKQQVTVSKWGYNRCCGALGYIRMLGADDALLARLPSSESEWPNMDRVCAVCAFGNAGPKESAVGRPFSPRFECEATLNQAGRQLAARLGRR